MAVIFGVTIAIATSCSNSASHDYRYDAQITTRGYLCISNHGREWQSPDSIAPSPPLQSSMDGYLTEESDDRALFDTSVGGSTGRTIPLRRTDASGECSSPR